MMMMKKDPKRLASIIIEMGEGEGSKGPYEMGQEDGAIKPPPPGALFAIQKMIKGFESKDPMKIHEALMDWKDIVHGGYDED